LPFAKTAKVAPSGRLSLATVGLTTDVRSNDNGVPFRRWKAGVRGDLAH
jgi:hypothetical protein